MEEWQEDLQTIGRGIFGAMTTFDLVEFQEEAQKLSSARELYELWDEVCQHYDRLEISKYELEKMKSTIWPAFNCISEAANKTDQNIPNEEPKSINMCPPNQKRTHNF